MVSPPCVSGPDSLKEWIFIIIIVFLVILSVTIIVYCFQIVYSEEFNYNSCLKYDEEDAGICDMIFPPLRFEAV